MADDIKLYINDRLVEFSTDPNVLYTYQVTDMSNPTVVKNSFSKQIQIDGTPNNNDVLGHYWDVERYIYGNNSAGGAYFNSSKKAPFQLFMGSDLYEEGYAKLDSIQRDGAAIKYSISLYGGLGDFFWSLSASDDGKEKKLSDLTYMPSGGTDEFDFTANIENVHNAWSALENGTAGKWQYINFMPAYNGKPADFNSNKVVINMSGTTLQKTAKNTTDDKWYSSKGGWTIGTLPDDMTEWEMRDLRSYLQRPCIKMSAIINACCNPDNNGGYEVDLDPDFFSQDNEYWTKTWVTLPMVQNLEYSNEEQILEGAELVVNTTTGESTGLMYQNMRFDLGDINSDVKSITVKGKIITHASNGCSSYIWFWNWNGDSAHPNYICLGSLFCQLVAMNGDTVVGASQVYNLTTPIRHNGNLYYGHNGHYPDSTGYDQQTGRRQMGNGTKYIPYLDQPIYDVLGDFGPYGFKREISHTSSGSTFDSNPYEFTFNINNIGSNVTGLKMVYYWGASEKKVKQFGSDRLFNHTYSNGWVTMDVGSESVNASENSIDITSHNLSAVMGESLGRTGTKVTKQLLLNTESTPCDYLLSFCKMFGLHFLKDVGEKRIHILTRKSFYDRAEIKDLEEYIDRSRPSEITPIMFKSKWYQFVQDKDDSSLQQKYLTTKGVEYGCKILDTGYEFNAEKIDLLKDNCLRSGIECVEKSKWFTAYNNDDRLRPWMSVGLKYTLWNGDDTFEYDAGVGNSGTIFPINEGQGLKYYDIFPKLQFHGDNNSTCDGNNVLVFYSGFKNVVSGRTNPLTYILSDDTVWQTDLNEGTPCWLFTTQEVVNNKRLCYKLNKIPVFERYLTGAESGTIQKSLDFGSAQELYVPNYNLTDDTNIYHSYWRTYLTDLFDANTKQMTCYIRVIGKPNPDWFRRFYWFDNSLWVLNKLADWNPASQVTTKAEFIKVQDISNYTSVSQTPMGTIDLTADVYSVHYSGGTVTLTVTTDAGVSWRLGVEGGSVVTLSSTSGTGTGSVTATFSANPEEYQVGAYITATRNDNAYASRIYIHQAYEGDQSFVAQPRDLIFPYSGGTQDVNFVWFNQGSSYVDYIDYDEGEDALQFSCDYDTYKYENRATVTVSARTSGDTVLHNYCQFKSNTYDGSSSIGIDQLPEGFDFANTGGTVTLSFPYADEVTFLDLPYWITVVDNGNRTFDVIAAENPTSDPRAGSVTVSVGRSSAAFNVRQDIDSIFKVQRTDGTGNILATGQTATLHVDSITGWTVSTVAGFVTLSKTGSTATDDMTVTFSDNTGETRQAILIFTDQQNNTINYKLTQSGIDGEDVGLFQVTRTNGSANIPSTGGTAELDILSPEKSWSATTNDAFITMSRSGYTDSTSMTVTFSANTGSMRYCSINFYDELGNEVVWSQTQDGYVEFTGVTPTALLFDATGGTQSVQVSIGDNWMVFGRPTWTTVSPTGGTSSATVSVTAIPYSGNEQRSGTVVFVDRNTDNVYLVTCVQSPAEGEILAVSPSRLVYPASGGTRQLTIIANTDWTIG